MSSSASDAGGSRRASGDGCPRVGRARRAAPRPRPGSPLGEGEVLLLAEVACAGCERHSSPRTCTPRAARSASTCALGPGPTSRSSGSPSQSVKCTQSSARQRTQHLVQPAEVRRAVDEHLDPVAPVQLSAPRPGRSRSHRCPLPAVRNQSSTAPIGAIYPNAPTQTPRRARGPDPGRCVPTRARRPAAADHRSRR